MEFTKNDLTYLGFLVENSAATYEGAPPPEWSWDRAAVARDWGPDEWSEKEARTHAAEEWSEKGFFGILRHF